MNKNFDPAIGAATRWRKKGPSPNPAGRPKKTLLTDALRSVLAEPFPGDKRGRCFAEVIAWRVAREAAKGDLKAVAQIADRTEGRVRSEGDLDDRKTPPILIPEEIQDPAERMRFLTEELRRRIALRKSRAPEDGASPD
jgi:hypothetical protein